MSEARSPRQILNGIRRSLRRGELSGAERARPSRRGSPRRRAARRWPARSCRSRRRWRCSASGRRPTTPRWRASRRAEVPGEVVAYLARNNLPAAAAMAPSPLLDGYDWASQKMLALRRGRGEASDQVSITGAFAGIAETGTLVMASGPEHPVTLNLLPDTHVVVLRESDIVGGYEDVWARLRARYGKDPMPRTVNTITGPSRTGDIEQAMELGAHGPRRMHIVVVRE